MGFRNFMNNRYGTDELSRFLVVLGFIFIILTFFINIPILTFIAIALIIYVYFRMFSRNFTKRSRENQLFLSAKDRFFSVFSLGFKRIKDRDHKYFKCPRCKRMLRVPKGKGRISIHCPTCGTDFIRTS